MLKPVYNSFLNLSPEESDWETSQYCVIQAPFEHTTSFQTGCALGPQSILKASEELNAWDSTLDIHLNKFGVSTLAIDELTKHTLQEGLALIESKIAHVLASEKWPLILGGEQSLSIASLRAHRKVNPKVAAVFFDSQLNLKDRVSGSANSSRSVLRRCYEDSFECIHLGHRQIDADEKSFLDDHHQKLTAVSLKDMRADAEFKKLLSKIPKLRPIYISIDLAVLDPALCPAVNFPEPGGLMWEELLNILSGIFESHQIVGADICGLSPLNGESRSDVLAARLSHKILSLHAKNHANN